MVIVPVRWPAVVLAATLKPTVPLPVPDAPEVTVIQEALLCAVQSQLPVDVTLTMPVLPDAPMF